MKKFILSLFAGLIFINTVPVKPMDNIISYGLQNVQSNVPLKHTAYLTTAVLVLGVIEHLYGITTGKYELLDGDKLPWSILVKVLEIMDSFIKGSESDRNEIIEELKSKFKNNLKLYRTPIQAIFSTIAMAGLLYKYKDNLSIKTKIMSLIVILASAPAQFLFIHPEITELLHKVIARNDLNKFRHLLVPMLMLFGAELNSEEYHIPAQCLGYSATELACKHNNMQMLKFLLKYFGWALSKKSTSNQNISPGKLFDSNDLYLMEYALKNNLMSQNFISGQLMSELRSNHLNYEKIHLLIDHMRENQMTYGLCFWVDDLHLCLNLEPNYIKKLLSLISSSRIHHIISNIISNTDTFFGELILQNAGDKISLLRFYQDAPRREYLSFVLNSLTINTDININRQDEYGHTLLIWLSKYYTGINDLKYIKKLLHLGADTTIKDCEGKTFYDYAQDRPEILEVIKEYKANVAKEVYESTKKVDPNLDTSIGNGLYPHVANIVAEYV